MGQPKLALPFAGRTVLEHVVRTLREGGVRDVIVVTASHLPELHRLARGAGADLEVLPEVTYDMRSTVEHGLRRLEQSKSPQAGDAFFLAPADHPAFSADLVRKLCKTYLSSRAASIVLPMHMGHRGHPALIAWKHVPAIRAIPRNLGINSFLRDRVDETIELETTERGVLLNLDHPEDYVALQCYDSLDRLKAKSPQ
jgi:CTP:molybdopterin cytidylyltransferase MocA